MKNSNVDEIEYYDEVEEEFYNKKFIPFKNRGDLWKDVEPVPQFSDDVEILKIDYDPVTKEINDYFRAILQKNEISHRAYELTKETSATNYMAWYHLRLCIDNIENLNLNEELDWVDSITLENQKNYQIWHHRKVLIEKLNDPSHEKIILNEIFDDEPKNFHAWCHRIWVVRRFNLFDGEFEFVDKKLNEDVRNNSVWNYRFFLIKITNENNITKDIVQKEVKYTLEKMLEVPNNESPYSYIRGLLKEANTNLKFYEFPEIKDSLEIIIANDPNCSYAYSMLVDIYEESKDKLQFDNIISKLIDCDYIRKKYWLWRKEKLC